MNVALRKLAMLEKIMNEKEETAKIEGYVTRPVVDTEFRQSVTSIMNIIRAI